MPMTNLQKLEALLWGSFWAALGGLTTGSADWIATMIDYPQNDWTHTARVAGVGALMGIAGYWRKNKALFEPPPVLIEDTTQIVRTPPGQPDIVVDTHKETKTVSSEEPKVGP
jgi:hypothetical protein